MKIKILFEDDFILIVSKPANILIHNSYYARNIKEPTLLDLLLEQLGNNYYPVHRLDRKTSGVLVLCKSKERVALFQNLFTSNQIQKIYLGVVRGFVTSKIIIDSPVKNPDTTSYKEAYTFCEPLVTKTLDIPVKPYKNSRYSLVKLTPKTGRMHQLRIHMNKISHPIIGDYKYGDRFHNRMFESEFDCSNLFLHAYALHFKHPITKQKINITSYLPEEWLKIFESFKWNLSVIN